VSNVQQAREALGRKLRELRHAAGISGRVLADRLSWPPSKISKLETGKQTPTEDDLRAWAAATVAREGDSAALLAMLATLETAYAEWQRLLQGGARHHQKSVAELERGTTRLRAFEPAHIPGLLQTAMYARHRLAQAIRVFGVTNDIDDAVRLRMARQEVLHDPRRRFHFVITEAALRYRLCPPEVMLAQLDRLVSASTLPNLRLGVIAFETAYVVAPGHGFWIFDDERVLVETFAAEQSLAQPQEIELHTKIFGAIASVASYGTQARTIIHQVMTDLSAAVPHSPDEG
jgi:transcriptional regulator with XRE-family HTH domain